MKKALLSILICSFVMALPQKLEASQFTELSVTSEMEDVRISVVNGNSIRVQNAQGATMEIYNVTGVKVATHKIDSADKTISPNLSRGCYIVKIGKTVRKVSIL